MKLQLWLVDESAAARLFAKKPNGGGQFWVPRSVTPTITKFNPAGDLYRRCEVEIEDWWARKNGLT